MAGLQEHFAWLGAASGASCYLRDLLVGPFSRAKIAALEAAGVKVEVGTLEREAVV